MTPALETVWDCYPPPPDVRYRITSDEWNDDRTVRHVKAWVTSATWPLAEEQR